MAKATVKSKSGSVIMIEGTEREVSNILATIESATKVTRLRETAAKMQAEKREQKKRLAASDLVVELKEDGFFDKPRSLPEITHALEAKGYIYPMTTLSGVMISLVQKKLLGRKKLEGKWVYGK